MVVLTISYELAKFLMIKLCLDIGDAMHTNEQMLTAA